MPRQASLVAAAVCAGLLLAGCSSSHDGDYAQYLQLVRQSVDAGLGRQRVSRQEAAAIPYASMGYRVDGGNQALVVLASDANGEQIWTAKSRVVIQTRDGRITRTIGLPHDIAAVTADGSKVQPAPAAALAGPVVSSRQADFPDIAAYGVPLSCRAAAAGPQTITILGSAVRTLRVDETCHSPGWSFTDNYWIEPRSGQVWRSRQHIHPKGETVETEILRPAD